MAEEPAKSQRIVQVPCPRCWSKKDPDCSKCGGTGWLEILRHGVESSDESK